MKFIAVLLLLVNVGLCYAQTAPATSSAAAAEAARQAQQAKLHYVEIGPSLKGDYKFGYDTGSGPAGQSFREETRADDGSVRGAYGYIDANGKQRIVKYSAGKAGFVVEGDEEAPGQSSAARAPAVAPAPAAAAQAHVPALAPAPALQPQPQPQSHLATIPQAQPAFQQQPAQPHAFQNNFGQFQRAAPQPQPQLLPQPQPQPAAPVQPSFDPQNGQFFATGNDPQLNQMLMQQLRQLQSGPVFSPEHAPPQAPVVQQPAQLAAPTNDFNQLARARQAQAFQQQQQQQQQQPQTQTQQFAAARFAQPATSAAVPAGAQQSLIGFQQQQQEAQLLANLRQQQLLQLQQQQRLQQQQLQQQQLHQQQAQHQQPQPIAAQPAQAPIASSVASQQATQAAAPVQPEVFGPPVIDVRTLQYSIGQQTRLN